MNFDKLEDYLEGVKNSVDYTLVNSMQKTAKQICKDMRSTVPVDTGKLKRSIHQKTVRNGSDYADSVTSYIYVNAKNKRGKKGVKYWKFVEFGTGIYNIHGGTPWTYKDRKGNTHTVNGQPPQAFVYPSVRANIPETLGKYIQKYASKHLRDWY